MTILDRVLSELRKTNRPILSTELAAKVEVTDAALEGMISVLVAKGRLAGAESEPSEEIVACSGTACGTTCVGLDECPFIVEVPSSFALVIESVDANPTRKHELTSPLSKEGRSWG